MRKQTHPYLIVTKLQQKDGGIYKKKYPDNKIDEAACWAHTRRKFYEITLANPDATIANQVLEQISKIYKIEEEVRGLKPEERQRRRSRK